jgi:hypothetical protein
LHPLLDATRSMRHPLGLRQDNLPPWKKKGVPHQLD